MCATPVTVGASACNLLHRRRLPGAVDIDGSFSFGQYRRSIRMNLPLGAGSQLASLSLPGDSFWM